MHVCKITALFHIRFYYLHGYSTLDILSLTINTEMTKYTQPKQQESNSNSDPYYVPSNKSGNLFQKIKGFFNSKSQSSNNNKNNMNNNHNDHESINNSKKIKKPYNFDNVNVSAIDLSINSNLSFTSKNPNDTLSEFFNKKGDTPLNDIEIEGVMSLIRKSQNSRAPSRNTSAFITNNNNNNHHHSMFLNSNLDSKLNNGLTSFNDMNNTTILRPASKNMKIPVRINTPTFKSKKPLISNDNNTSLNNTSVNNSTIMNKSSFINNSNISKSFINKNGIRKRRIVDYSTLQSPYKLRNSSSSLTAFLEKKKLLEKQANEEKKKSLLAIPKSDSKQKDKVYNGGIIDLSTLDDEEEEEEDNNKNKNKNTKQESNTEKKKTLQNSKTENISKTASKLLEILESNDSNKQVDIPENIKKDKKKDNDDDSIIILNDKSEVEKQNIKPSITSLNTPVNSKFSDNQITKKEEDVPKQASTFNFQKNNKETEIPIEKKTIEKKTIEKTNPKDSKSFSFPVKDNDFVNVSKGKNNNEENTQDSKSGLTIANNPIVTSTTKSSNLKFETQPLQIPTSTLFASVTNESKPKEENTPINNTDIEVIDSFTFPEVETKQNGFTFDQPNDNFKNNNDEINGNSNINFSFPMIPAISEKSLTMVKNAPNDVYNDVFRF